MCWALFRFALLLLLLDCTPCSSQRSFYFTPSVRNEVERRCDAAVLKNGCHCKHRVRLGISKWCCCVGESVTSLPPSAKNAAHLFLRNTSITFDVLRDYFSNYTTLTELEIHTAPLREFDYSYLRNHTQLLRLVINNCTQLQEIKGTLLLPHKKLKTLDIQFNALRKVPTMQMPIGTTQSIEFDLSDNLIEEIAPGAFRNVKASYVKLNNNLLKRVEGSSFTNAEISHLYLQDNPDLTYLSPEAFLDIKILNHLDLSKTSITSLPSIGMEGVIKLFLTAVNSLKQLPSILSFSSLKHAYFTYPHHCCLFKHFSKMDLIGNDSRVHRKRICKKHLDDEKKVDKLKEDLLIRNLRRKRSINLTFEQSSSEEQDDDDGFFEDELPPFDNAEIGATRCEVEELEVIRDIYHDVVCTPIPDAMNPCESIVGYPWLRYAIWFFWLSSVILNVIVWIILAMAYETRKRAHYIFMFNLSFANALSAIYLGLLAIKDMHTQDEYFRFAVEWQTGFWCKTAGFLCVFSSSLSILSMFFIAFEIAYSTRQSIFGKHLPFRTCIVCVVFSYVFSFIMAALPLFEVSDYSKTSTCLPLFIGDPADQIYIIFGLSVLITAFIGMVACYGSIFKILVDPKTPSRPEDHHIIMKMLALIGTDMVCWMPTCILGLAAAFGSSWIDISTAKIFIICFFPLNTFTNPFLYVFLTKVIRSKVKKRAVPIFKRLVDTPRHTLHSLSVLYHMHGPDDRRRKSNDSSKFVSINQPSSPHPAYQDTTTTKSSWLNGEGGAGASSRGSGESTALLEERPSGWDSNARRSTPRVSFQSTDTGFGTDNDCPHHSHNHKEKKGRFASILKKVSAIPEVSDLSEHSSDSHHEHVFTMKKGPKVLPNPRRSFSVSNCTHNDSGRSSLASIFARSETSMATSESSDTCTSLLSPLSIDDTVEKRPSSPTVVSERKIILA